MRGGEARRGRNRCTRCLQRGRCKHRYQSEGETSHRNVARGPTSELGHRRRPMRSPVTMIRHVCPETGRELTARRGERGRLEPLTNEECRPCLTQLKFPVNRLALPGARASSTAGLCTPVPTVSHSRRTARGRCILHSCGLSPLAPCRFSRRTGTPRLAATTVISALGPVEDHRTVAAFGDSVEFFEGAPPSPHHQQRINNPHLARSFSDHNRVEIALVDDATAGGGQFRQGRDEPRQRHDVGLRD
jgi:hypothetical protein